MFLADSACAVGVGVKDSNVSEGLTGVGDG